MAGKRRTKPREGTEVVSFRVPNDLVQRLDALAEADDRTRSKTALRLLRQALDAAQPKAQAS